MSITIGSLFSGYGGLDLAVSAITGGETIWVADLETDPDTGKRTGPSRVLSARFPNAPNLGDITRVDWSAVERPNILLGGFPCQDVSMAGRRAGLAPGSRSGLWSMMAGAIDVLRPDLVVIENVRGLLSADGHADVEPCPWCLGNDPGEPAMRALGSVLADLADVGYDAAWQGVTAASVGAPHGRFRVFIIAWPQPSDTNSSDSDGWATAGLQGETGSQVGPASDPNGDGFEFVGWQHTAECDVDGCDSADANGDQGEPATRWGAFAGAIGRWTTVLGRPAPDPTEQGPNGGQRLSPRFVEWMMGLPAGWVTDVDGLSRNDMLKLLGNGVVPQQAASAVGEMLDLTTASRGVM